MKKLTKKQSTVLEFLISFIAENGFPPSRVEIARHFKFVPNAANDHLQSLKRRGAIDLVPGVARGIRVIADQDARRVV
jgi:repressor LexA